MFSPLTNGPKPISVENITVFQPLLAILYQEG